MIVILTSDEEVDSVLQTSSKKVVDMEKLYSEYANYTGGEGLDKELSKDPVNVTKKGTIKANVFRKALKKRDISFAQFLIDHKKFKAVDYIGYDF